MWLAWLLLVCGSTEAGRLTRKEMIRVDKQCGKFVRGGGHKEETFKILHGVQVETIALSAAAHLKNSVTSCGGSLISPRHVLTAAHCWYNIDNCISNKGRVAPFSVDDWRITIGDMAGSDRHRNTTYRAVKAWINERFASSVCNGEGDIAIIELDRDVADANIFPFCLPRKERVPSQGYIGFGWGLTEAGMAADVLRYVDLGGTCEPTYPKEISKTFCSDEVGQKNVCAGDSGGGILQQDTRNRLVVHGLVSHGTSCMDQMYKNEYSYGVNTDVRAYGAWICYHTGVCPTKELLDGGGSDLDGPTIVLTASAPHTAFKSEVAKKSEFPDVEKLAAQYRDMQAQGVGVRTLYHPVYPYVYPPAPAAIQVVPVAVAPAVPQPQPSHKIAVPPVVIDVQK